MALDRVIDPIERATALDRVAAPLRTVWRKLLPAGPVRDTLHGVPLGHPLHPMLTDVTMGAWTGAAVVDALPATGPAAPVLVAAGLAAAVPTIVSGWADWTELHEQQQRVGLVHAASNATAVGLYAASLVARARGRRTQGKVLGWAGYAAVTAGGWLGGHLAYRQAAGTNHAEHVPHLVPSGWQPVGRLDDLPEGAPARLDVGGVPVVAVRRGSTVQVLAAACSHLSAPLDEGELTTVDGADCVVCPWHRSTFRLSDGAVVHGPATAPQPSFDTRVLAGTVEVRMRGAG